MTEVEQPVGDAGVIADGRREMDLLLVPLPCMIRLRLPVREAAQRARGPGTSGSDSFGSLHRHGGFRQCPALGSEPERVPISPKSRSQPESEVRLAAVYRPTLSGPEIGDVGPDPIEDRWVP